MQWRRKQIRTLVSVLNDVPPARAHWVLANRLSKLGLEHDPVRGAPGHRSHAHAFSCPRLEDHQLAAVLQRLPIVAHVASSEHEAPTVHFGALFLMKRKPGLVVLLQATS